MDINPREKCWNILLIRTLVLKCGIRRCLSRLFLNKVYVLLKDAQVNFWVFVTWCTCNIGWEYAALGLIEVVLDYRGIFHIVIWILEVLNIYVHDVILRKIRRLIIVPGILECFRLLLLFWTLKIKRKWAWSVVFWTIHSQVLVNIRFDDDAFI